MRTLAARSISPWRSDRPAGGPGRIRHALVARHDQFDRGAESQRAREMNRVERSQLVRRESTRYVQHTVVDAHERGVNFPAAGSDPAHE